MTKPEFLQQVKFDQPTVFIMRGLPGSGKSTIYHRLVKKYFTENPCHKSTIHCSADNYWTAIDGSYKFDLTRVPQSHHFCLRVFCEHGMRMSHLIFLDNTNTSLWEFSHYVKIAEAYDYKTVIITLNISVETALARNIHNVPEKTIRNMYKRLNDVDNNLKLNAFCREHKIEQFSITKCLTLN
jgi:predicted kinase